MSARFITRTLVCTAAIGWNAIYLIFMIGEMVLSDGNVTLNARPQAQTMPAGEVIIMLLGFGASLVAAWCCNTEEHR